MGLKRYRHKQRYLRCGLPRPERYQLLRRMTDVLVKHERIETTWHKAKALRVWAEPMVTWARSIKHSHTNERGVRTLRHKMAARCEQPETLDKMFDTLADRYRYRTGGYLRIIRTRRRYRDDALMAFVEFVDRDGELRKPYPAENSFKMSPFQYDKQRVLFESKPGNPYKKQKDPEIEWLCPPHLRQEFRQRWHSADAKGARKLNAADLADINRYEKMGISHDRDDPLPKTGIYIQKPETMETVE